MRLSKHSSFIVILILATLVSNHICFSEETSKSYSELLREAVWKAGMSRAGYGLLILSSRGGPPRGGWGWGTVGPPRYRRFVEGLDEKEAVPFLLQVVENGPPWESPPKEHSAASQPGTRGAMGRVARGPSGDQNVDSRSRKWGAMGGMGMGTAGPSGEYSDAFRRFQRESHMARCYALLSIAATGDERAFPLLVDVLKNSKYLVDPEVFTDPRDKHDIREYAAAGLCILEDDRAVDLLVSALDDANTRVVRYSMFALAKMKDVRVIEPILNAARNHEVDDRCLGSCMTKLTKTHFESEFSRERMEISFPDFPELGALKLSGYNSKFWQHWLRNGKKWTEQKFEDQYEHYIETKRTRPNEESAIRYNRWKMYTLGVAALPLIIQRIEEGETDFIPLVSVLTEKQLEENATREECLAWWEKNKERWLIPFEEN